MIKVLLVERQAMLREALARLLDLEGDMTVLRSIGYDEDGEVVSNAVPHQPDVVVLSLGPGRYESLRTIVELRARVPRCRVLILTALGDRELCTRAMVLGAHGYIVSVGPVERLAHAIRKVYVGEPVAEG